MGIDVCHSSLEESMSVLGRWKSSLWIEGQRMVAIDQAGKEQLTKGVSMRGYLQLQ